MAKKTLANVLQCPIDFIYLWASDGFIAQLGSKARIIKEKKYNQYQTLWKIMVDNVKSNNSADLQDAYIDWTNQIADAIKNTYGMTPAVILQKLAMGEDVLGKNWKQGIYGIGEVQSTFSQNSSVTVDGATGQIMVNGVAADGQVPIYGSNGVVTGYSYYDKTANAQFQSGVNANGQYGAACYSNESGVQSATGGTFDQSTGSFWSNAANYIPLIQRVIEWLVSLFGAGERVVLTRQNTVPEQTEWVEENNGNGGLIAGGLALAGLALITMEKPKNNKKK